MYLPGKIPTLSNFSFLISPYASTQLNVAGKKNVTSLPDLTKFITTNLNWIWCLVLVYFPHVLFPVILSRSMALNIPYVTGFQEYTTPGYVTAYVPCNSHLKQPCSHENWIQCPV